jgi:hypothetical protein
MRKNKTRKLEINELGSSDYQYYFDTIQKGIASYVQGDYAGYPISVKVGDSNYFNLNDISLRALTDVYTANKTTLLKNDNNYKLSLDLNRNITINSKDTTAINLNSLFLKTTGELVKTYFDKNILKNSEDTFICYDWKTSEQTNPIAAFSILPENEIKGSVIKLNTEPIPKNVSADFTFYFILNSMKEKSILNKNCTYNTNMDILHHNPKTPYININAELAKLNRKPKEKAKGRNR